MTAVRAELERQTATPEAILADPGLTGAVGTREWAIRELRRFRDENRSPEAIQELLNMETGKVDDALPFIEHNYDILPPGGSVTAGRLKAEVQKRNSILEFGSASPEAATAKTDIFNVLIANPDVQQYIITILGVNPPAASHPQVDAMLKRIVDSPRFQAAVRTKIKEGIAPDKAVSSAVMQEAQEKQKARDEKKSAVDKLKKEQTDVNSKTSPTGLAKVQKKYDDDWDNTVAGNKREDLINVGTEITTKKSELATAEAEEDAAQTRVNSLVQQIREAEKNKNTARAKDLTEELEGTRGSNTSSADLKKAKEKVAKVKRELEESEEKQKKLLAEKAQQDSERRALEARQRALPDEIKDANDELKRLDKEYGLTIKPIEQQATAYMHEVQQAYKKAAAEWITKNREEADAARQAFIQEEIGKSKDALSRVIREQMTTRWSQSVPKLFGRGNTVKPRYDQIDRDYQELIDPSRGANGVFREMLRTNVNNIPDLYAHLHGAQLRKGSPLTGPEEAAAIDEWGRKNKDEVDGLRKELAGSIMWERWQHGSAMGGRKPIAPSEAEFILKQPWGEGAFNDMILKNTRLQKLNNELVAAGIERNNLIDWYRKASGGNIAILLALIFGTVALGGLGFAGAGAVGIGGLAHVAIGAAGGSVIPTALGMTQR